MPSVGAADRRERHRLIGHGIDVGKSENGVAPTGRYGAGVAETQVGGRELPLSSKS